MVKEQLSEIIEEYRQELKKILEFLSLATRKSRAPIEALGYTPEEFADAENHIFLDCVAQNGKVL